MIEPGRSALQTLTAAVRKAAVTLELRLHRGGDAGGLEAQLAAVARAVVDGTGGEIALADGDGQGPPALPALTVVAGGRQVAHYLGAPEGSELPPFLDLLLALAEGGHRRSSRRIAVAGLDRPAELTVFMVPGCPNCPHAVRAALMLAAANPQVGVAVVDATAFPGLADAFGVRSVPLTVVDGGLALTGVVAPGRLAQAILERGRPGHLRRVFASMLDTGRFADAAELLTEPEPREHFADLWRDSSLEQRIGLMLTAEHALAADPGLMDGMVGALTAALDGDDRARRGDTADLLGRIGSADARAALEGLLEDPDPEVADAAADALE